MTTDPRFDECLCAACRRPTIGLAVIPKGRRNAPLAWVCNDPECIQIARNTYDMKQIEFHRIDELATQDGGNEAGAYLDKIGKTDLAQLSEQEWQEFCRAMVGGYRTALKTKLQHEAPF